VDPRTFDRVTRALAAPLSRRTAIVAAVATITAGHDRGAAAATCRPGNSLCIRNGQCCSGVCVTRRNAPRAIRNRCCGNGLIFCNDACVDVRKSVTHCGACGTACGTAQVCTSGVCTNRDVCSVGNGEEIQIIDINGDLHVHTAPSFFWGQAPVCQSNGQCATQPDWNEVPNPLVMPGAVTDYRVCAVATCAGGEEIHLGLSSLCLSVGTLPDRGW